MRLADIIPDLHPLQMRGVREVEIGALYYDSRRVTAGGLFFALPGATTDGHRFIADAVESGAAAVVSEREMNLPETVAAIRVSDARHALAEAARTFYHDPTAAMTVVGITGTNGKTTISYMVEALLTAAGRRPAVTGTVAYRFADRCYPAPNTTPESLDLQHLADQFRQAGSDSLVMEVSSHALDQQRVVGVSFDVAVFTNLTPEHLDYHRDMEDYFAAKSRLFRPLDGGKAPLAVINVDDPYGARLAGELPVAITCGRDVDARVRLLSSKVGLEGIQARVMTPHGELQLRSPLLGHFNLSNLLCAAAVGVALDLTKEQIENGLASVNRVPGRLEPVANGLGVHLLVDYAHTGDALEKALETLKSLQPERLICLFGCGGDRDRGKRPVMGEVAGRLADLAIVSSDNPRTEDPQAIIADILPGLERVDRQQLDLDQAAAGAGGYLVIPDRGEAIDVAVKLLKTGDMLLVAGKGHEDYQIVGRQKIHFDDREQLLAALARRKEQP